MNVVVVVVIVIVMINLVVKRMLRLLFTYQVLIVFIVIQVLDDVVGFMSQLKP